MVTKGFRLGREFALKRSSICERCNSNIKIEVHHRDRNTSNNEDENLEVVCRECHIKEHINEFGRPRTFPPCKNTYKKAQIRKLKCVCGMCKVCKSREYQRKKTKRWKHDQ